MKLSVWLFLILLINCLWLACRKDSALNPPKNIVVDFRDSLVGNYQTRCYKYNWSGINGTSNPIYFDSIITVSKIDSSKDKIQIFNRILAPYAHPYYNNFYLETQTRSGGNAATARFILQDSIFYHDGEGGLGGGTVWSYWGKKL